MKPIGYKYIFGRLTFYVEDETLEAQDSIAIWKPLEGEEFDVIHLNPSFKNPAQAILHEELHALFNRIGVHQTSMTEDMEEQIVEAVSQFFCESYGIKPPKGRRQRYR